MNAQSRALEELRKCGFTLHEARTYLSLLSSSPATGYEVSKATGLAKANAYGALDSLQIKGCAQLVSQNPARYVPVSPDEVLNRVRNEVDLSCSILERDLAKIARASSIEDEAIWNIRGRSNIALKVGEMIRGARRRVAIKALDEYVREHEPLLLEAERRGVEVRVVLFGEKTISVRGVYLHEGSGATRGVAHRTFTVAVDDDEALVATMEPEAAGGYTRNEAWVSTVEALIRHDLYMTEIVRELGAELDQKFGRHLESLRRQFRTAEPAP